jgi:phosphate starvation-inducible PhoH-like protein
MTKHLKVIENALGIEASARDNMIFLKGDDEATCKAKKLIMELQTIHAKGKAIKPMDLKLLLEKSNNGSLSLNEWVDGWIPIPSRKKFITPKSHGQRQYVDFIKRYDVTICIGPAGTGKSYLAMAMAINALLKNQFNRIILTRPAVEAGEKLGFLPGDIAEKLNPYFRPLYDALFDIVDIEKANKMLETGVIEIAPLAFMRGRTLNDAYIILDEAQNTTSDQMKMFLTRLGLNSKMIINGDITQVDLPNQKISGLVEIRKIASSIEGIGVMHLGEKDVVRHPLVQKIIKAYENYQRNPTIQEAEA